MGAPVSETYGYKLATASGVVIGTYGGQLGGFMPSVSGTLKLNASLDGTGAIIVDTIPVTAGTFVPLPFNVSGPVYATLGGGAQGTFAVN